MKQSLIIDKKTLLSNIEQKTFFVSNDFVLKDSLNLPIQNDHLMAVAFNNSQDAFVLVDFNGILTWKWKNKINKNKREIFYDSKETVKIIDAIFNSIHRCYFCLYSDNSIGILNTKFEEVFRKHNASGAILCMVYNSKNDELITSTVEGFKIYTINIDKRKRMKKLMDLYNYFLVLKKEFYISDNWIKKMEIDDLNCHLYCCSSHDLYIFDFNWNLIRHFKNIHNLPITCVIYSPTSKCFITGSMDNSIKIWSTTGDCIDIFKSHSKSVIKLVLNPYNSDYFLSASLDGSIKMWSLDINQVVYEIIFKNREIFWMGFTDDKFLYVATQHDLSVWSINNFINFWSNSKDRIISMKIDYASNKNNQILAVGEEKSVRIYDSQKAEEVSTILPLPFDESKFEIKSISYSRNTKYLYVLLNEEIWIFYTKTYPSSKVSVWDTNLIQKNYALDNEDLIEENPYKMSKKNNFMEIQNLIRNRRSIEFGLLSKKQNEKSKCRCIGCLESNVIFWNLEGQCTSLNKNFLLLGFDSGNVLFCDPLKRNKKYAILNCSKDPVVDIIHDKKNNYLITKIELKDMYEIQYWTLPDLIFVDKIYFSTLMTAFNRINDNVLVGFENGSLEASKVIKLSNDCTNKPLSEMEIQKILTKSDKYEHKQKVEMIDVCHNLSFFLSFSKDGQIKIWNQTKKLIVEICLDRTLSACCFLNDKGDIITSWQKHLFKISLDKIIPELRFLSEDNTSLMNDSEILNEEYNFENENESIFDMSKYLNPYNLKLNNEGKIEACTLKKKKDKKENKFSHLDHIDTHADGLDFTDGSLNSSNESSFSFLSSPRTDSSENLVKIDLTLDSHLRNKEIHQYLVNILIKNKKTEKKSSFPKQWKSFPKVGKSPSRTPEHSSPDISPRGDDIKDQEIEASISKSENTDSKLNSQKKEKASNQIQNNFVSTDKMKESNKENDRNNVQSVFTHLTANEKSHKERIIVPLSMGTYSRSALPLKDDQKDSHCKRKNKPVDLKEHSNKNKINIQKKNKVNEANKQLKNTLTRRTKSGRTESFILDSNLERNKDISNKNIEFISKKYEESFKEEIFDLNQTNQATEANKLSNFHSSSILGESFRNEKQLDDAASDNQFKSIKFADSIEQNKYEDLFNHIYLNCTLPKRISSGVYQIGKCEEVNKNKKIIDEKLIENESIENMEIKKDSRSVNNEINIPFFEDWIANYKFKKNDLNKRMKQAKLKREILMFKKKENLINSIYRENSKLKVFSAKDDFSSSNYKSEINASNYEEISSVKLSIDNVKGVYFVSQLEMEEILKEVNEKLFSDKKSDLDEKSYQLLNNYGKKFFNENSNCRQSKMKNKNYLKKRNNRKENFNNLHSKSLSNKSFRSESKSNKSLNQLNIKASKSSSILVKSASSIPSKTNFDEIRGYPEIKLRVNFPGSPEKYLLPIRFPKLYRNLIRKLKDY